MLQHTTWHDAPALVLVDGRTRALVVPAFGGKIASLVHVPSGREWLWRNASLAPRIPEYGADFERAHDVGGWDECFPAVRGGFYPAAPWRGCRIPDHGELWCTPWDVIGQGDAHVTLGARGTRFPYRFERTIRLEDGSLLLDYAVRNESAHPFPFLWSAHPLIAVAPGMTLDLPAALGGFRCYSGGPFLQEFEPPGVLPEPGDLAIKCFAPILGDGAVSIGDGDSSLCLRYAGDEVTHLNLWLNCGGWSGAPEAAPYYNLGLEPGIGPADDLDLALSHLGDCGILAPKGQRRWTLEVTLS